MGIGQAITMPLFFASNALYPVAIMPGWLKAISLVNPLSYEVAALRGLLIGRGDELLARLRRARRRGGGRDLHGRSRDRPAVPLTEAGPAAAAG